jgi:CBS domain-containing protein
MTDERIEPQSRAGLTQDHRVSDLVRDVMSPQPRMLRAEATISEAAEVMRREDIGDVIVVDADRLYGMLTDRDIVLASSRKARTPPRPGSVTFAAASSRRSRRRRAWDRRSG